MPLPARGEQLTLADTRSHRGPRPESGRKEGRRPKVRHRKRPAHAYDNPVHVTMRRAKGLPSFRVDRLHELLKTAIRDTRRDGFRIVHDSIQNDHLHMLVEAVDARFLTNGMKSFAVRVAMRVNRQITSAPASPRGRSSFTSGPRRRSSSRSSSSR